MYSQILELGEEYETCQQISWRIAETFCPEEAYPMVHWDLWLELLPSAIVVHYQVYQEPGPLSQILEVPFSLNWFECVKAVNLIKRKEPVLEYLPVEYTWEMLARMHELKTELNLNQLMMARVNEVNETQTNHMAYRN